MSTTEREYLLPRRTRFILATVAVALGAAVVAAVATSPGTREVTIPAGTRLVAALERSVSTEHVAEGTTLTLETTDPLPLGENAVIPGGIVIRAEVTHAKGGGRIAGAPELTLRFRELEVNGNDYPITADPFRVRGKDDLGESVGMIGGGAVAGGVIGAISGGDALEGAVVGAVIGTGVAVATRGGHIVLGEGQRLRVRLAEPVTVRYRPESEPS